MRVKTISQDGDYGIFVRIEADDGELLNFYVCAGDDCEHQLKRIN